MLSPLRTRPMEARIADSLPEGARWQFEPKWDGSRCLAFRDGDGVDLRAKSGKSLTRFFPEIASALLRIKQRAFVVDGELAIPCAGALDFDALQMRLHPAESRIRRLSAETPAILILFDMLENPKGRDITGETFESRRKNLEVFFAALRSDGRLRLSPKTRRRAEALKWLGRAGGGELDGVVAKDLDLPYLCGERAMIKVKCLRSADCVVGGFRYASGSREIGSLLLGLYNDEGLLDHVGFTSGIPDAARSSLTRKLERLRGGEGFSGVTPGGPSRWSRARDTAWEPVRPVLVAEVRYDHVTANRFRHGTRFLRWRPEKSPRQCTLDQLSREATPWKLIQTVLRGKPSSAEGSVLSSKRHLSPSV